MRGTLLLTAVSAVSGGSGVLLAAADPTGPIAPIATTGTGVLAVGALVEVCRRLLNGRLIPREVQEYETEMGAAIRAAGEREAVAMANAEAMRKACQSVVRAAEQLNRTTEEVQDDIRVLRRILERGDGR